MKSRLLRLQLQCLFRLLYCLGRVVQAVVSFRRQQVPARIVRIEICKLIEGSTVLTLRKALLDTGELCISR